MRNMVRIVALLVTLVLCMDTKVVYASEIGRVNMQDSGVVNIKIDEFTINEEGKEVPWVDGIDVLPGMKVSKIPYFTATGEDCYIRATVKIEEGVKTNQVITIDDLAGISDDWIRAGDYFYYKYPLKTNETLKFFQSVTIPSEWDNSINPANVGDWSVVLNVVVDAIQAKGFSPDFESDNPWGDISIQENKKTNQMRNPITGDRTPSMITVIFAMAASGVIVIILLKRKGGWGMRKAAGKVTKILSRMWAALVVIGAIGLILIRWGPVPFGYQPIWCMSNSMAPTFHEGSLCYIDTNYDVDTIREGDVIAFALSDGSQVTHRIYDITEEGIITKGDANEDVDISPISKEQIIGENVYQIEYVGNLFREFPNMLLFSMVFFAFVTWKLLDTLSDLMNNEAEEDEKL